MPVYGVEPYLRDAIDSVLAQTYQDIELILVDDGSPDGCPAICDEYAARDSRIRVIHKPNGGVSSARNAALDTINDGFISFVDSDDTIDPDIYKTAIEKIGDYDILIFGINTTVLDGTNILAHSTSCNSDLAFDNTLDLHGNFSNLIKNQLWNFPVDKLYRADIIKKNGIRFNSYFDISGEDTVFLLDLFPHIKNLICISDIGYNYYIRSNQSMVKRFRHDLFEKNVAKIRIIEALTEQIDQTDKSRPLIAEMYLQAILWSYEQLFHRGCKYSLLQKSSYVYNTFRHLLKELPDDLMEEIKKLIPIFNGSFFTQHVVKNILNGNYNLAALICALETIYINIHRFVK